VEVIEQEEQGMLSLIPWKKENGSGRALTAEPWEREFSRIRSDFDSLLSRMWSHWPALGDDWMSGNLATDFDETATHYKVRVTAPGFETEDFDVSISGNNLVVKAERKESEHKESENGKNGFSYRYGQLQRVIPLPDGAQLDQVEARYHSGILELKVPKGKENHAKRIEVKSY
jgi:HSP20 family protein